MADIGMQPRASLSLEPAGAGGVVAHLAGEYDLASLPAMEGEIERLLASDASSVVVDVGELDFMDSSGVAVLLRLANRFGPIEVLNPSSPIRRIIETLGLAERLRLPQG